ncbi:MAG: hypothetical protein AAAB35_02695 [Phyllobacterium sp.]|uniref:hypothetical protein n=1 Tax=Phyllobacterium sp. TaxID=1871046 RepID=UPI0030F020A0
MLKLLAPLLTSLAAGEVGLVVSRAKQSAAFMAIIAILVTVGFIFLLVAAQISLAEHYGRLNAALMIAGSAFGLAIIAFITMRIASSAARRRQEERAKVDTSTVLTIAALALAPALFRSRALLMLTVPLVALGGLSLAGKKKKRRPRPDPSAGDGI